LILHR